MKILINATALVERGPYSLIKDFLEQVNLEKEYLSLNNIRLTILVSKRELLEYKSQQIKVIYQPYPKKSLFHRLYFERFLLPYVLKEEGADAYLSLQNTSLYKGNIPQIVLIQQSLHFSGLKFSNLELINIVKYSFLMDFFTRISINNYSSIIVQTNWVKEAVALRYGYKGEIKVIRPLLKSLLSCDKPLTDDILAKLLSNRIKLLYVTSEEKYKNNPLLIKAVIDYNKKVIEESKKIILFLTIEGKGIDIEGKDIGIEGRDIVNENAILGKSDNIAKDDGNDIIYLGKVPYHSILNLYKRVDALIFPSLCETLGLPLMEAMMANLPVLAANLPYAREVCGDKGIYFEQDSSDSIIEAITKYVERKVSGKLNKNEEDSRTVNQKEVEEGTSYIEYIDYIYNIIK